MKGRGISNESRCLLPQLLRKQERFLRIGISIHTHELSFCGGSSFYGDH
jgi:hypothetical protein